MSSKNTKPVLISIAVVCLVVAGFLMYRNLSGGAGTAIDKSFLEEPMPMYCLACNHNFEMPIQDFRKLLENEPGSQYDCPSCGKKALQSGFKCVHCGNIFPIDYDRNPRLRCPSCGKGNSID